MHAIDTPYGKLRILARRGEADEPTNLALVPGFSESIPHSKQLIDALARAGFDAMTHSQPRRSGTQPANPINRQADILRYALDETFGDQPVHGAAHSLGAAALLRAAITEPERFESVTLLQPVGLAGDQDLDELVWRTMHKSAHQQFSALHGQRPGSHPSDSYAYRPDRESRRHMTLRVLGAQAASAALLMRNPALAAREAVVSGEYELLSAVAALAEQIPVHVIVSQSDEMFDHALVDQTAETGRLLDLVSSYASVADRAATHDTSWLQPIRTTRILGAILR